MLSKMFRISTLSLVLAVGFASCLTAAVLDDLDSFRSYKTERVSSYDKRGGNADGGQGNPQKPGVTRVIADITGPGRVAHIWVTMDGRNMNVLTDVVLRAYWDGESTPSIEVPIGEFFGEGFGRYYTFESLPVAIGNDGGLNCYFPMPFAKSAKFTIENVGKGDLTAFYYYIDYQKLDKPSKNAGYFHAQYRQEKPTLSRDDYTILDATGRGHFVGCFMFVRNNEPGWFGEGDDLFYIDGAKEPTLYGTGTEDYFCEAWGLMPGQYRMRFGSPLDEGMTDGAVHTVYRFHLEDAVTFTRSIKLTIEHGHANDRSDDASSVAYWYQTEPHATFPALPSAAERMLTVDRGAEMLKAKRFDDYRKLQADIRDRTVSPYVKQTAEFNMTNATALEQGGQKGVETMLEAIGPFPTPEISKRAATTIKSLGGDVNLIPAVDAALIRDAGDGSAVTTIMDGSRCVKTDQAAKKPYIYFDVNTNILRNGNKPVTVEVEYYDQGIPNDVFWIEYDAAGKDDKYHESNKFVKLGKKGWSRAVFQLEGARFGGRQNGGGDFRICCGSDADEYVRGIKVTVNK